jgi:hypothetical protein
MNHTKTYSELTTAEVQRHANLTAKEQAAVDAFLSAAKALPRSICVEVTDDEGEPNLVLSKRITRGSAQRVASLRKKSLCF